MLKTSIGVRHLACRFSTEDTGGRENGRGMGNTETDRGISLLWHRILGLLEEDLAERRARKLVVRVRGESGPNEKEIGELSAAERRSLDPVLGEHVAEQLLDRYLAEPGYVDLIDRGHAYRRKIGDLIPADLPALVEANRESIEERREKCERPKFVQDMQTAVDQLQAGELAEMVEASRSTCRSLGGASGSQTGNNRLPLTEHGKACLLSDVLEHRRESRCDP
jgi:hypothetical protein